jgi:hypothetical protein
MRDRAAAVVDAAESRCVDALAAARAEHDAALARHLSFMVRRAPIHKWYDVTPSSCVNAEHDAALALHGEAHRHPIHPRADLGLHLPCLRTVLTVRK